MPGSVRARALIGLANLYWFQGRHVEAGARAAEALSLGRDDGDAWVVSFALFLQGTAAFERGDHEQAEVRSREARDAADASGEDVLHGPPLLVLGNVAVSKGDYDRAQQLYDQSIEVLRRAGETWGLSIVLLVAAGLRIVREDYRPGARAGIRGAVAVSGTRGSTRDWPGVSKCSRACWPPQDSPTERPDCGVPRSGCWKA